ncbi:MAG: hypothetical protein ACRD25_09400, partial [Terracidiphilus sp.]
MEKVAIPPARVMRIIWFGFVLSGVMLIYLMFVLPARTPKPASDTLEVGITIVALVDVVLGFLAPRFLARFANSIPEGRQGAAALSAWLSRNLVGIALIYSCNLVAFALHMLGARADLVEVLFGVG